MQVTARRLLFRSAGIDAPSSSAPIGRQFASMPSSPVNVEIFTTSWCGYCKRAKALLESKGVAYQETDIEQMSSKDREALVARANGRTSVPQIFAGSRHLGGHSDIVAMNEKGELDTVLGLDAHKEDGGIV